MSHWRVLYRAALQETDGLLISQKVSDAETAILARERQLSHDAKTLEERENLQDALYILRALREACQHREADWQQNGDMVAHENYSSTSHETSG